MSSFDKNIIKYANTKYLFLLLTYFQKHKKRVSFKSHPSFMILAVR